MPHDERSRPPPPVGVADLGEQEQAEGQRRRRGQHRHEEPRAGGAEAGDQAGTEPAEAVRAQRRGDEPPGDEARGRGEGHPAQPPVAPDRLDHEQHEDDGHGQGHEVAGEGDRGDAAQPEAQDDDLDGEERDEQGAEACRPAPARPASTPSRPATPTTVVTTARTVGASSEAAMGPSTAVSGLVVGSRQAATPRTTAPAEASAATNAGSHDGRRGAAAVVGGGPERVVCVMTATLPRRGRRIPHPCG